MTQIHSCLSKEYKGLEGRFFDLASSVVEKEGLKLYDLEFRSKSSNLILFIYDEKTKTAILDDCVKIDRAMTEHIEQLEWIPDSLNLEVSSPGVFRKLVRVDHFLMSIQERVSLTIREVPENVELVKELKAIAAFPKLVGILKSVDDSQIEVEVEKLRPVSISFEWIKKANLEPEF